MTILLFIISLINCVQLVLRMRLLPKDSLGEIGVRIEIVAWIMFLILLLFKPNYITDPGLAVFIITIALGRIFSSSSIILGHPIARAMSGSRRKHRHYSPNSVFNQGRRVRDVHNEDEDFQNTVIS